ncbi:NDP-hexose 2,3-dehydratase family protein, partial [Saccharopolyspora taberi]
ILGIVVRRFDGIPHFLMQAKMEPGNINLLQLSPTVQATRSNYTRIHQGKAVPYLEYFVAPRPGRVLSDVLQSEQGSWFLHKRNRNMIVEIDEDVPVLDGFRWVSEPEMSELLRIDNLVNMDSRTVLADYSHTGEGEPAAGDDDSFRQALANAFLPGAPSRHRSEELRSWLTEAKTRYRLERTRVPLNSVPSWIRERDEVSHEFGRYFSVVGVDVEAGSREVASWSQPMIAPRSMGVVGALTKRIGNVLHVLVRAHTQAGTFDIVEIGPTVQCAPGNYEGVDQERWPPFLHDLLMAPASQVRFDAVHSEEGGRFYHATNRYLVVEIDDGVADEPGDDFVWMTAGQLADRVSHGGNVNVEARNLLTCLRFLR